MQNKGAGLALPDPRRLTLISTTLVSAGLGACAAKSPEIGQCYLTAASLKQNTRWAASSAKRRFTVM